jgi:ABC-type multidrug transport system fused ATPase/permease subunit
MSDEQTWDSGKDKHHHKSARRRSTLTPPELTLDIEFKKLRQAKLATKASDCPEDDEHTWGSGEDKHPHMSARRRSTLTPPELTLDIEFEKLSLTIPKVGTLMSGVTGSLMHGSLTAIMGPSGAGKCIE